MSHYLRPRIGGARIFFTVALDRRGSTLLVDEVERLRVAVRQTMAERPFRIEAWVVLPDHLHAIWTLPAGDADYAIRWGAIKARFSRGLAAGRQRDSHLLRREKGIWQRRYWEHHLLHEADFQAHLRFCWQNPVRHGLVTDPLDWPFSSVHRDRRAGRHASVGCASCAPGERCAGCAPYAGPGVIAGTS